MSLKLLAAVGLAIGSVVYERANPKPVPVVPPKPRIRPPGAYLSEMLYAKGWSPAKLARLMGSGYNTSLVFAIIHNRYRMKPDIAQALSQTIGQSKDWWLARQLDYDYRNR